MDTIRLYFKFVAIHLKSALTYKASFLFGCLGHVLIVLNAYLGMSFLMERFDTVGGYALPELTLCHGIVIMAFSLAEIFGRGFDAFSRLIRTGMFDRLMVCPRSLVFQVLCQDMRLNVVGRVIHAGVMLYIGIHSGAVDWTWGRGLTLAAMVLCGAMAFFGVFMIGASLCFFTMEGLEVMNIFTDGVREYGKYPFDVYGKGVLVIVTAVVPFAMCQYWPLQYLLGRKGWVYGCFPLLSLWFLIPCFCIWRLGVRHYHSAGS